jgi:triphosphoribosyl-dephospho-CoA synthase
MFSSDSKTVLGIGQCATLACFLEATAPKPGNVHRGADFDDLTYPDLIASAIMI